MAVSCTNLQVIYDDTDYSSGRCIFRWRGAISNLDHFEVLPMYYSVKQKIWVQEDSSSSADVWGVDGWYQHHWTAPDASVASLVKFYVRPVTTWTDSDGKSNTSYGDWSLSGEVKNPRWIADQDEQRDYKYKFQTERPDAPTMTIVSSSNTQVVLGFRATSPRVGSIEIQRRMDGGAWGKLANKDRAFYSNQAPYIDHDPWPIVGTTNYTDKTIQAGHNYEYRARCLNTSEQYVTNISGSSKTYTFNGYEPKNDVTKGRFDGPYGEFCDAVEVGTKPARPTFVSATLNGPDSVLLEWVENGKNTAEYDIQYSDYRGADGKNPWEAGVEVSHLTRTAPATRGTVTGLAYGKRWYFRVYARNQQGEAYATFVGTDGKAGYATRYVYVPAEPAPTITAPKSVSGKEVSGVARITWSGTLEQDATFSVEHSLRPDAWDLNIVDAIDTYTDAVEVSTGSWMLSKSDLKKGATHYFRVVKTLGDSKVVGTPAKVKVALSPETVDPLKNPTNFAGSVVNGNARLTWGGKALGDGESYQLQYSSDPLAFTDNVLDSISEASLEESFGTSHVLTVTSLDEGTTYWFRVRWRSDSSASQWVAGAKLEIPLSAETKEQLQAPTPATTLAAYPLDEQLVLSWTHNSGDDTEQTTWHVLLGGDAAYNITPGATTKTNSSTVVDLSSPEIGLSDGDTVTWKVRTQGAWEGYWSPWSKVQAFNVYARPVASVTLSESPVTAYPFTIDVAAMSQGGSALPTGNTPLNCSVYIAPVEPVEASQPDGSTKLVAAGEPVWSGFYGTSENYTAGEGWSIPMAASDVSLSSSVEYKVSATVTTMQGMRCETECRFSCEWSMEVPAPRAVVSFDPAARSCRVFPWCEEFLGFDPDTGEMLFQLLEGVELAVYRVNPDGTAELVADGIENDGESYVDDPRCAFGTATYRIVAKDPETGVQNSDEYSAETPCTRVVVEFGAETVELKYNVEWTEEHNPDVELLRFHGRSNPVAHWGTQAGQTFKVRGSLIKGTDAETLAKLRRLSVYRGACYVREPTGLAWWAQVVPRQISGGYNTAEQKVELEMTRIEA